MLFTDQDGCDRSRRSSSLSFWPKGDAMTPRSGALHDGLLFHCFHHVVLLEQHTLLWICLGSCAHTDVGRKERKKEIVIRGPRALPISFGIPPSLSLSIYIYTRKSKERKEIRAGCSAVTLKTELEKPTPTPPTSRQMQFTLSSSSCSLVWRTTTPFIIHHRVVRSTIAAAEHDDRNTIPRCVCFSEIVNRHWWNSVLGA